MLDSASSNHNIGAHFSPESDVEFNGTINRAVQEGPKFSLLLAMVEQNCIHRPHIEQSADSNQSLQTAQIPHHYREPPLSANLEYWQTCQHTSQLVHNNQLQAMKLWLTLHPEPLSQHNNPQEIDEEVVANCSISTQNRLQQSVSNGIAVDETRLYEVLQKVDTYAKQSSIKP